MAASETSAQTGSRHRTAFYPRSWPPAFSQSERRALLLCALLIVALTALRCWFAATIELRMDEAYYWAWSGENVLSYLDHPPLIAWSVRIGTAIFGDTTFGIRFGGIACMAAMQVLLADIVWRMTRDVRSVVLAALMPEAAVYFGLSMAKVAPDTALVPCCLLMVWGLLRAAETGQGRWWIVAGAGGGLALLAKYTAVLFAPAVLVFLLMSPSQRRWLLTPWPWVAGLFALAVFSPVIIWNAQHDWASFRFQSGRLVAGRAWVPRFVGDYIGLQFALVGPILMPVALSGTILSGLHAWRRREPVTVLLACCALFPLAFFLWRSLTLRIFENWPMFAWPFAFAAAAINVSLARNAQPPRRMDRAAFGWAVAAIASGIVIVVFVSGSYVSGAPLLAGRRDPVGQQAAFAAVAAEVSKQLRATGATWVAASEYGTWAKLNWYLRGQVPVIQINQRARFLDWRPPDMSRVEGKPGLFVAIESQHNTALLAATSARLELIEKVPARWRGTTFDESYLIEKIEGWTPVLNPPPGSPLYVTPNW